MNPSATLTQIIRLARYAAWANQNQVDFCLRELSPQQRRQTFGAGSASVHAIHNHLLQADILWLKRFTAQPIEGAPMGDDRWPDFADLAAERQRVDAAWINFAATLDENRLGEPLTFYSFARQANFTGSFDKMLLHALNHQTHHRAQVSTLLRQLGFNPPVTDLFLFPEN